MLHVWPILGKDSANCSAGNGEMLHMITRQLLNYFSHRQQLHWECKSQQWQQQQRHWISTQTMAELICLHAYPTLQT
jgi:hypothetical protein